jgi:hypothetical protein
MTMGKKIYGFYLVVTMNDWKKVFLDQINYLVNSNLFNNTEKLYLRVFYSDENELFFIQNLIQNYTKIYLTSTKINEFEFGILDLLQNISLEENFYCYYFHTKGVSIDKNNVFKYHKSNDLTNLKINVESWRKYMEYFVIENYENCLYHLKEYDACGVNLVNEPSKHFSGNFWWSKSSHINKLPEIKNIDINHRWNAEFWIGRFDGKFKNFYSTKAGYVNRIIENYKKK